MTSAYIGIQLNSLQIIYFYILSKQVG